MVSRPHHTDGDAPWAITRVAAPPWPTANRSRCLKRDVQEFGGGLAVLQTLGEDTKRERLDTSDNLSAVLAVAHHSRETRYFRQPTAVVFAFDFDRKGHAGNVPSRPPVSQGEASHRR